MKKTLSIILAVLMVFTAIPLNNVMATAADLSGFKFLYNDARTKVTVSSYSGSKTSVEIPSEVNGIPVVGIDSYTFADCANLEEVIIPDSVTQIGAHAFDGTAIYKNHMSAYPKEPLYIDGHLIACKGTYDSGEIVIAGGTKSVASFAFEGVSTLKSITVPASLVHIGSYAFKDCIALDTINFVSMDGIKSIGTNAFINTAYAVDEANWDGGALYVGNHIVDSNVEGEFIARNGTRSVADGAFLNSAITIAYLGDSLLRIGEEAFKGCTNLEVFYFGSSVETIDKNAFTLCNNLKLYYGGLLNDWLSISFDNLYANPMTCAVEEYFNVNVAAQDVNKVIIGADDTVTKIPAFAFSGCNLLNEIIITDKITEIGEKAFINCNELINVTLPNTLTKIDKQAFLNDENIAYVNFVGTADEWATISFNDVDANPITYSKNIYFNDVLAENVVISEATEINYYVFNNCESIKTLEIKLPLKTVLSGAFNGCVNLTDVNYEGTEDEWKKISIGENNEPLVNATKNCYVPPVEPEVEYTYSVKNDGTVKITGYKGTDTEVVIPETIKGYTVSEIGANAFYEKDFITSIEMPDTITNIGENAFGGCTKLINIKWPANLKRICTGAFVKCTSLTNVTLPEGVEQINESAFAHCYALETVVIPEGCLSIKEGAFRRTELSSITLPDTLTYIEYGAFDDSGYYNNEENWENGVLYIGKYLIEADVNISGSYTVKDGTRLIASESFGYCESLTEVILPDSLEIIGWYAFGDCTSLQSVVIPNSVTDISEGAFSGCEALTDVTLSESITEIYPHAFEYCKLLETITIPEGVTNVYQNSFIGCSSLTTIYLPNSIEIFNTAALSTKNVVTDVYYNGTKAEWANVTALMLNKEGITIHCLDGDVIVPENGVLTVGSAEAYGDDTITIPVTLTDASLSTLSYTITYDSTKLQFVSIDDIPFDMYETNTKTKGKITVFATNNSDAVTGVVANVTFKVIAGSDCTTSIDVAITDAYDSEDVAAEMVTVSGTVDILVYEIGDLNGDGDITAIDARWILQIAAGNRTATEKELMAADVNGDGQVTAIDARWVLQIAAGTRVL